MREIFLENVRDQPRGLLRIGHLPGKEFLSLRSDLLLRNKIIIVVALLLRFFAVKRAAELADKEIDGSAVAHKMVRIRKQNEAVRIVRLHDLESHGRSRQKVKRTHECLFICLELPGRQLPERNLRRAVRNRLLDYLVIVIRYEAAEYV